LRAAGGSAGQHFFLKYEQGFNPCAFAFLRASQNLIQGVSDMAEKQTQLKSIDFSKPHEVRELPKGKIELITLNGVTFGRATCEPGWRWSTHVKPIAGTSSCQAAHLGVQLSGVMHIKMDDGTEMDIKPGQAVNIPPGHDAWVVGKEPVVFIDITGMENYAKQTKAA